MSKCECEHHCHCHDAVKKIANVATVRQELVIAISMLHKIFTKKEIWYFLPNLFFINLKLSKRN